MIPVTKKYHYVNGASWYVIMYDPDNREYRWRWVDTGVEDTLGPNYPSVREALVGASEDAKTNQLRGTIAKNLKLAAAHVGSRTTYYY